MQSMGPSTTADVEQDGVGPVLPSRRRLFVLPAGWPLQWLLVGFPIFWVLGLSEFAVDIMAVPMAADLLRRRPIKLPHGFGFWALFLLWSFAGVVVLGVDPVGTLPDSTSSRLLGYLIREVSYISVTVVLLYVGNLDALRVPQKRVRNWLAWLFAAATAGGVAAMLWPNLEFTSPFELVLPGSIRSNNFVQHLVHPATAQVQAIIGDATPRPAAPFTYTNAWSFYLTILGVWFFVGRFSKTPLLRRILYAAVAATAAITLIYSLNRAAWIGVALAVACVTLWLASRGKIVPLAAVVLTITVATGVFFASPLRSVVEARLENGKSNDIRSFTTRRAFELSVQSPIMGFASTRNAYGSSASIAIGKSDQCPQCGNASIGMNGYIYLLIVSTGYVGVFLFFGMWAVQAWRARRLHSPTAVAGCVVLLMTAFYGFFYDVATSMLVPFITIGLLWREREVNDRHKPWGPN